MKALRKPAVMSAVAASGAIALGLLAPGAVAGAARASAAGAASAASAAGAAHPAHSAHPGPNAPPSAASTGTAHHPKAAPWNVTLIAQNQSVMVNGNPMTLTNPDDVTRMGSDLFVAYQNGVGPQGQPASDGVTFGTVVEYGSQSNLVADWNLTGKIDGLTADPRTGKLIATVNEDANTSIYTVDPSATPASQVVHYQYSPANPLPHGGGTDAISILDGQVLLSASAPGTVSGSGTTPATMPAVYRVTFSQTSGSLVGTATLIPLFYDGSQASVGNFKSPTYSSNSPMPPPYCQPPPTPCTIPPFGTKVNLALTDPDSSEIVPASAPRYAGDFVLDSQGDQQLIFVSGSGTRQQRLSDLYLSQSIDDTAYVTDPSGTLYITEPATDEVVSVTGPFRSGEAIVAATPGDSNNPVNVPNYVGTLSLRSGTVTAVPALGTIQPVGMTFAER